MRSIRLVPLLCALLWLVAACGSPADPLPQPQPQEDLKVQQLEARVKELEARLAQTGEPVNLINPNYPPAAAGEPGWVYHKSLSADLDGDGKLEQISVTTNAAWLPDQKEFGWDDGHPWHVYVEEENGSRTYLFSDWVQMGRLDLILDRDGPGLFILSSRGGGLIVYRVTYSSSGETQARRVFAIPLSDFASWADPTLFIK